MILGLCDKGIQFNTLQYIVSMVLKKAFLSDLIRVKCLPDIRMMWGFIRCWDKTDPLMHFTGHKRKDAVLWSIYTKLLLCCECWCLGLHHFLISAVKLAVRSIVMILKKIQARLNILFFSFFAFGFIFISFPHFTVAIPLLQYVQ